MSWHAEILPPEQQWALHELGRAAAESEFYLGGGTAIAIHLGHRQSLDLDWFTGQKIANPLELGKDLQERGVELQITSVHKGTVHGEVNGVPVRFLEYRHPLLAAPIDWPDFGCRIASLDDLAAMKLLAVTQRGTKKDFLDVHAMATHGLPLVRMLTLFRQKFGVEDVSRVLYSLCYFADADPAAMPRMHTAVSWEQVKAEIRAWVKSIAS